MVNIKKLRKSFKQAFKGLKWTLKEQQNFRIQVSIAILVVLLAVVLRVKVIDFVILLILILIVLILELINTAFERIVDILKPRIHQYAEIIKDILAGCVLLASMVAIIAGILIFWPYIF
ncbi:diacylglycerol kinase [Patescibacteria group bacterium]|nr:diacylglycerol kinase [Patescibacteria group bacterium]